MVADRVKFLLLSLWLMTLLVERTSLANSVLTVGGVTEVCEGKNRKITIEKKE